MIRQMELATLKALKPSEFEDSADAYRATGEMASAAKDAIDNRITAEMRNRLEGAAAKAALRELAELSNNFHYTQSECGLVSTALNGFAFDMTVAKRKLDAALEDAQTNHCTVNADGSVNFPAGRKPGEERDAEGGTVTGSAGGGPTSDALERQAVNIHPNPYYGAALGYANRIADALREATDADARWAPKLRALKADDDLVVSDRDWADVKSDRSGVLKVADPYLDSIKDPPKGATPEENAEWWKNLTAEQRADCLAVHPASIGSMNGLPSDVRDEANRMVLNETKATYRLQLDAIPKEPIKYGPHTTGSYPAAVITPEWREWQDKYGSEKARMEGVMKGMNAIQDRFDRTGEKGLPEAYLLGFDPTGLGDGKVILANGNPDTADHVGVYVPGTFAGIESVGGDGGHPWGPRPWRTALGRERPLHSWPERFHHHVARLQRAGQHRSGGDTRAVCGRGRSAALRIFAGERSCAADCRRNSRAHHCHWAQLRQYGGRRFSTVGELEGPCGRQ
ncbi:hypothetical protein GCM10020227_46900 [Streptomyces flavovirens]